MFEYLVTSWYNYFGRIRKYSLVGMKRCVTGGVL